MDELFDSYIEADLKGNASNEQLDMLEQNIEKWRQGLVTKLTDIDRQLTLRRAQSIQEGSKEARINYETWKRSAMGRKLAIASRIQDIKAQQKVLNNEKNNNLSELLEDILEEVRDINSKLERK